jgi:hypothetical protein
MSLRRRRWCVVSSTVADGVGTGALFAAALVVVAERHGVVAAGVVAAGAAVGRLVSLWLSRHLQPHLSSPQRVVSAFSLLVWVMVAASAGVMVAAVWGPLWLVLVLWAVFSASNNLSTAFVNHEGGEFIVQLGPAGMVGQFAGALYGAAVVSAADGGWSAGWLVVLGLSFLVQLAQLPLMRSVGFSPSDTVRVAWGALRGPFVRGVVLALCAYGHLGLYAALVADVAGAGWVGWSMGAYAAGALCAPWLDRRLGVGRSVPGLFVLASLGAATWVFAVSGVWVVLGRMVAGALLFVAQGRLMRVVAADRSGPSGLVAVSVGLGVGMGVAGVWTGVMVGWWGVQWSGLVAAAVTLLAAVAVLVVQQLLARMRAAV